MEKIAMEYRIIPNRDKTDGLRGTPTQGFQFLAESFVLFPRV